MLSLALRSDKPEAELYLCRNGQKLAELKWLAHRELSDTLHKKMKEILDSGQTKLSDLDGLIIFRGPGSFTGLRIGIVTVNTLALALEIPVVGTMGKNWIEDGLKRLSAGDDDKIVTAKYGSPPNITRPRK